MTVTSHQWGQVDAFHHVVQEQIRLQGLSRKKVMVSKCHETVAYPDCFNFVAYLQYQLEYLEIISSFKYIYVDQLMYH